MPVFGLLFGALFLDEPFGFGTLARIGIILASAVLVTGISPQEQTGLKINTKRRRSVTSRDVQRG